MADNIQLDEGSSGKYTETDEISSGIHRQCMQVASVSACKLVKSKTVAQSITCTNANTDYTISNALASTTKYVVVYCASACIVSMGEATSASVGVAVGAGMPTTFPVTYTGTAADDKLHAQSPTAGAVVRVTEMAD
jgi:hypothetical protein